MSKEKGTKKKGSCLKTILIVVAVLFVIGIIASIGGGSNEAEEKPTATQEETKKEDTKEEVKEEPKEEYFETDLIAGNYVAGKDIPAGTYNLQATGGHGNVMSSNMFSGGINEIMGSPADEYTQETFNGLKLKKGDVLQLAGNVTLHIVSENALVSAMEARTTAEGDAVDLSAGNYTAGTDFPAGTYNIIATGNSGNVISSNSADMGINEIMGTENDGFAIQQFNNVELPEEATLELSGTSVQLVPVGK